MVFDPIWNSLDPNRTQVCLPAKPLHGAVGNPRTNQVPSELRMKRPTFELRGIRCFDVQLMMNFSWNRFL
jgi:hypothetical protein